MTRVAPASIFKKQFGPDQPSSQTAEFDCPEPGLMIGRIPSKDESYPDMEFERYYYGLTGVPKYTQCTSVLNSVC